MPGRPIERYCAAALAGVLVCGSALRAQPVELRLYVAASPQHDAAVVADARDAEGEVTVQGRAAARWVPLREPPDPADDLVVRQGPAGMELLVLLHDDAVTEADVASAHPAHDAWGGPAVALTLSDAAAKRMARFTSDAIGRRLAILLDGEVLRVPTIRAPVDHWLLVAGLADQAEVDDVVRRLWEHHIPPYWPSAGDWLMLIAAAAMLLAAAAALLLAALPAPGLQRARIPRTAWKLAAVVTALIGAFRLGVSYEVAPGPPDGLAFAVSKTINISLLGLLGGAVGGAFGGTAGLWLLWTGARRAGYNGCRFARKMIPGRIRFTSHCSKSRDPCR